MTARSSSRLVGVLAVVIVVCLGWLVISMRGRPRESGPLRETVNATSATEKREDARLVKPDEGAPAQAETKRAIPERISVADEGPTNAELAQALWVGGRVTFPPATPTDERAFVVAVGREFGSKQLHRVPVAADGTFKVGFAPNTKKASLRIDARYVYLEESKSLKLGEESVDVVLAPSLGGGLRGRLKLDASSQHFAADLVGATVSAWGWKEGLSNARTKSAELDQNLEFELGGLDPAISWRVSCTVKGFATADANSVGVTAGRFEVLELAIERGASVAGTVRDEQGRPVAGARLSTNARANGFGRDIVQYTMSAEDGRFEFPGQRAGEMHLVVEAQGFVMQALEPLHLNAGEERLGVDPQLSRGLSISGVARFSGGGPASDATIIVDPKQDPQLPHGLSRFREDPSVKTDAEGKFTITGLAAGAHTVSARSAPQGTEKAPVDFEDRREDVAAGTTDLVLVLERGIPISGRVVDDLGAPVAAFALSINRCSSNSLERSEEREHLSKEKDGTFEIPGLAVGIWEIRARTKDGGVSSAATLKIPEEARLLELVVPRPSKVRGTVLDPSGTPIAGASIHVDRDGESFVSWSDEFDVEKSDELGAFEVTERPGSIHVSASHSTWAPSAKVDVEVQPASAAGPLILQLRLGGTITGRVLDRAGKAESGRVIQLWAEGTFQNRTSDEAGSFRFERVTPGEARVSIQSSQAELEATRDGQGHVDEEAARPLNGTVRTTAVEGQVVDITLGGLPTDAVRVSGVVRARAPVNRARLRFDGTTSEEPRTAITDANGRYELLLEQPGRYSVSLERDDDLVISLRVEIPVGPAFVYDIPLPTGSIRGRVLDSKDAPVGAVDVSTFGSVDGSPNDDGAHVYHMTAKTKSDGTFTLSGLSPATYEVSAHRSGAWVGPTHQPSQARASVGGIELKEGASVEGLILRFPASGSVKGFVRNREGTPIEGARVRVRSIDPRASTWQSVLESAPDGSFRFDELATGAYTLVATKKNEIGESDTTVMVGDGTSSEVNLTLRPGNTLLVKCEDGEGQSVEAFIELRDSSGRHCSWAEINEEGEEPPAPNQGRRFGPLSDGEYNVSAHVESKDPVEQRHKVRAGVTLIVRLRLPE